MPATSDRNAVVLLSGGLDSATVLAMAVGEGFACHALSFRYGQRHEVELEASRNVASALGATSHHIVDLHIDFAGAVANVPGSALTSSNIAVPKDRLLSEITTASDVPVTYVPARNTIFLAYALAWAELLPASDLFIGANELDASGYPDCRPAYLHSFEQTARLGTRLVDLRVHAPLIGLRKWEIVAAGNRLGVDYGLTHSCYDPVFAAGAATVAGGRRVNDARACGRCDACQLRRQGFKQAGVADPTRYE